MTNEEIIKEVEMQYYDGLITEQSVSNRVPKEFIVPIQDITRKDERDKVIGEIEKRVNGFIYRATTDASEKAINRHYGNVLEILNSLREAK